MSVVVESGCRPNMVCFLCVQLIARLKWEMQLPSTSAERWRELQEWVKDYETVIKDHKSRISSHNRVIKLHQEAMATLQGEPFCVAIVIITPATCT